VVVGVGPRGLATPPRPLYPPSRISTAPSTSLFVWRQCNMFLVTGPPRNSGLLRAGQAARGGAPGSAGSGHSSTAISCRGGMMSVYTDTEHACVA
jgi:hypothetical protein